MAIENGDRVTFEYVGRLAGGAVFDTSREEVAVESGLAEEVDREYEPLTVEVGAGRIIEGLEDALVGMEAGDSFTVTIPADRAYGERDDDRIVEYGASEFRGVLQDDEAEEGMRVQTRQGEIGEIVHAGPEAVRVDFNHELAGESLEFEIEILSVE